MKVIAFAGYSGAGKTTLLERLIPLLKQAGKRVSVLKHAHHNFDIDHPGKDSYRHRQAGAFEVVVASDRRLALMREFERPAQLSVHQLIAELDGSVDWVLVEGFKHSDLHKIEVWRVPAEATPRWPLYPHDDGVCAIATDVAQTLPVPTGLPLFDLDDVPSLSAWLLASGERFAYRPKRHV